MPCLSLLALGTAHLHLSTPKPRGECKPAPCTTRDQDGCAGLVAGFAVDVRWRRCSDRQRTFAFQQSKYNFTILSCGCDAETRSRLANFGVQILTLEWKDLGILLCQSEHVGKNLLCAVKAEAGRSPVDYATLDSLQIPTDQACRLHARIAAFAPLCPVNVCAIRRTHHPLPTITRLHRLEWARRRAGGASKWTQVCTAAKQK